QVRSGCGWSGRKSEVQASAWTHCGDPEGSPSDRSLPRPDVSDPSDLPDLAPGPRSRSWPASGRSLPRPDVSDASDLPDLAPGPRSRSWPASGHSLPRPDLSDPSDLPDLLLFGRLPPIRRGACALQIRFDVRDDIRVVCSHVRRFAEVGRQVVEFERGTCLEAH